MDEKRYQIRYAGGSYWLLDMQQDALDYKIPLALNETGMYIFSKLEDGLHDEEISKIMSEEFNIDKEQALTDIRMFINMLIQKGIIREG